VAKNQFSRPLLSAKKANLETNAWAGDHTVSDRLDEKITRHMHMEQSARDTTGDRDTETQESKAARPKNRMKLDSGGQNWNWKLLRLRKIGMEENQITHTHLEAKSETRSTESKEGKQNKNETGGYCFHEKIEARTERSKRTQSDRLQHAHTEQKRISGWHAVAAKRFLRAGEKILDWRRKSDQLGWTGIKKNHRGRKIFEKKTNYFALAGKLSSKQKKNSSRENRKRWRIFDPVGKLLIRKTN
jgi:hypothetical protein